MILVTSCTITIREALPARTATEQLLTSVAIEQAVERLPLTNIPLGVKIYLDSSNFVRADPKNRDDKYAISAIKEQLLKKRALDVR
ncbi:hypothetical conserved protein [Candidatus Nitrosoglobus terrae]|uniref:Hypothetical conserved protein n=1 Tax=Candidatus Nitrosoglobus terrae TaxID=1630141 RepID=A0A1Q2SNE9_9GAMM|nr:hypothetical protein [Candidatus Nitrosoglobus terrae]BAW80666.1 hypothetical conserved protein [Candidatus Nitrosoglobus terrae]